MQENEDPSKKPTDPNKNNNGQPKNVARNLMADYEEAESEDLIAAYALLLIRIAAAFYIANQLFQNKNIPPAMYSPFLLDFNKQPTTTHLPQQNTTSNHTSVRRHHRENHSHDNTENQTLEIGYHELMHSLSLSRKSMILDSLSTTRSSLGDQTTDEDNSPEEWFSFQVGNETYIANNQEESSVLVNATDLHTPSRRPAVTTPHAPRRLREDNDDYIPRALSFDDDDNETPLTSPRAGNTPSAPQKGPRPEEALDTDTEHSSEEDIEELESSPIFVTSPGSDFFSPLEGREGRSDTASEDQDVAANLFGNENDEEWRSDTTSEDQDVAANLFGNENDEEEEEEKNSDIATNLFGGNYSDDDLPGSNHSEGGDIA